MDVGFTVVTINRPAATPLLVEAVAVEIGADGVASIS